MSEELNNSLRKMGKINYDFHKEVMSEVQMQNDEIIKGVIKEANQNLIIVKDSDTGKCKIIFCHAIATIS